MEYSKKQMKPLIDKFQINVDTNKLFQKIITAFDGKPNYQIWAVKSVFSKKISFENLIEIRDWAENNQQRIKELSKQNLVSYSSEADFKKLKKEIEGINMSSFVKNAISCFNTQQRQMLLEYTFGDNNATALELANSARLKEMYSLFTKFMRLPLANRHNYYVASSSFTDIATLINGIVGCCGDRYSWNKEDMLAFMYNNTNCEVVYDKGDVVIISVPDFKSSKLMCGNGRTSWCITKEDHFFKDYVSRYDDPKREQYFLFDFSKKETNQLAHIGFTVESGSRIVYAHSNLNDDIKDRKITVGGKEYNIHDALSAVGVKLRDLIKMKVNSTFGWDIDKLIEFVISNPHLYSSPIVLGNVAIINIVNNEGFKPLISHTPIKTRSLSGFDVDSQSKTYLFFNFDKPYDDESSTFLARYTKDSYGTLSLYKMVNTYDTGVTTSTAFDSLGIKEKDFLSREKIDSRVLLHKLIDENKEEEAIELVKSEGNKFDVNYQFAQRYPIFSIINQMMVRLFDVVVNHPNFNINTLDGFGETILQALIYLYASDEIITTKESEECISSMINSILRNDAFDFNKADLNNDTALSIACEYPKAAWVVEKLVAKPNVNVNVVNGFKATALTNCLLSSNLEALEYLGMRRDMNVSMDDKEIAKDKGIDLSNYLKPNDDIFTEENNKESNESIFSEAASAAF